MRSSFFFFTNVWPKVASLKICAVKSDKKRDFTKFILRSTNFQYYLEQPRCPMPVPYHILGRPRCPTPMLYKLLGWPGTPLPPHFRRPCPHLLGRQGLNRGWAGKLGHVMSGLQQKVQYHLLNFFLPLFALLSKHIIGIM